MRDLFRNELFQTILCGLKRHPQIVLEGSKGKTL
jgi:hypothetical protein